jgi:hypothetical protein
MLLSENTYIYHDSDNGKTMKKATMMTITVTMRTSPRTRNSLTKRFRFFIVFIYFIPIVTTIDYFVLDLQLHVAEM